MNKKSIKLEVQDSTATTLSVCSSQPTTLNEATTTYELATATLTAGDGNGDYTISDGDVDGRNWKITFSDPS